VNETYPGRKRESWPMRPLFIIRNGPHQPLAQLAGWKRHSFG
jgi:hypothetical protein